MERLNTADGKSLSLLGHQELLCNWRELPPSIDRLDPAAMKPLSKVNTSNKESQSNLVNSKTECTSVQPTSNPFLCLVIRSRKNNNFSKTFQKNATKSLSKRIKLCLAKLPFLKRKRWKLFSEQSSNLASCQTAHPTINNDNMIGLF